MSVAKVVEIMGEGNSIQEAIEEAFRETAKTVRGIREVYVDNIRAIVENDRIVRYRVHTKISFMVEDSMRKEG